MVTIGVTGGIGSGKTTVCKVFEWLGIPVYYADLRARWLIENDEHLKSGILSLLGKEVYSTEGKYLSKKVAERVFGNPDLLAQLNQLVHPVVKKDTLEWLTAQKNQQIPYVLKEAALLFESGTYRDLDYILFVSAPLKVRMNRVMQRDGISAADFELRIKSQWPDRRKMKMSDFVIINDGRHSILNQIFQLHTNWIQLFARNTRTPNPEQ
jgi:dephospho-CoA kinase